MSDLKKMTLGQVVDYTIAYNNRQKRTEKAEKHAEEHGTKRRATQNDIDSFFG